MKYRIYIHIQWNIILRKNDIIPFEAKMDRAGDHVKLTNPTQKDKYHIFLLIYEPK